MPKEKRHLNGGPLMPVSDPGEELHTPEYERRIAETLGPDRDRRARDVRERAERRERIATHVLAHLSTEAEALLATSKEFGVTPVEAAAIWACQQADALMAELDRRRDAELQEARDA